MKVPVGFYVMLSDDVIQDGGLAKPNGGTDSQVQPRLCSAYFLTFLGPV